MTQRCYGLTDKTCDLQHTELLQSEFKPPERLRKNIFKTAFSKKHSQKCFLKKYFFKIAPSKLLS